MRSLILYSYRDSIPVLDFGKGIEPYACGDEPADEGPCFSCGQPLANGNGCKACEFTRDEPVPLGPDRYTDDEPGEPIAGTPVYGLGLLDDFVSERDLYCNPPADLLDELADRDLPDNDYSAAMARHRRLYRMGVRAGLDTDCPPEEPTDLSADDLESWIDGASVAAVFCHARYESERDVMVAAGRRMAGV